MEIADISRLEKTILVEDDRDLRTMLCDEGPIARLDPGHRDECSPREWLLAKPKLSYISPSI